jgi:hypothetical protein
MLTSPGEFRRQQDIRAQEEAAGIPPHRQTMVVQRMITYVVEYAPQHQHLVQAALEHYASNLGQLWGGLFLRYGRPRWVGGQPCDNPDASDPLASVPGYVEASGAAASSAGPATASFSSSPAAPARHELEPPS